LEWNFLEEINFVNPEEKETSKSDEEGRKRSKEFHSKYRKTNHFTKIPEKTIYSDSPTNPIRSLSFRYLHLPANLQPPPINLNVFLDPIENKTTISQAVIFPPQPNSSQMSSNGSRFHFEIIRLASMNFLKYFEGFLIYSNELASSLIYTVFSVFGDFVNSLQSFDKQQVCFQCTNCKRVFILHFLYEFIIHNYKQQKENWMPSGLTICT